MSEDDRSKQALVQGAMDAILIDHDREAVRRHFHPHFVQHNPWAEDGGAHVEQMCDFTFGVEMRRWAVQGDLVAYHGLYTAPNPLGDDPLVCVDVWRVQGERIVEHWDALMPTPADAAEVMLAGGGDGMADVAPDQVATHAATARRFLEVGVTRCDAGVIDETLIDGLRVHRPGVEADAGKATILAFVEAKSPRATVKRTIASGDLVFVHLLLETTDGPQAMFDVFRFDGGGRIAEMWSVGQAIVAPAEAANPHPHF